MRRGASVGQRLKLLAEVVRQDDPGPEGTGHERPPCGWGNNRDGDRLILRHPWPGVQTLAANLRNCHLVPFGIGTGLYIVFIANIRSWGTFGWGPRYLVPVLPIVYALLAVTLVPLWCRIRVLVVAFGLLSVAINLPSLLVNWSLVLAEYPSASNAIAPWPYQQTGIWQAFLLGIQGQSLPASDAVLNDPVRRAGTRFPDLWTIHLMRQSRSACLLGLMLLGGLLSVGTWSLIRIVWRKETISGCGH